VDRRNFDLPHESLRGIALGASVTNGSPRLVLVVVGVDETAAAGFMDAARELVDEGVDVHGTPWADRLRGVEITVEGPIATLTATVDRPGLWFQMVQRRDGFAA